MWSGSKFSRWIGRGVCVCPCAMSTPPKALASRDTVQYGRRGIPRRNGLLGTVLAAAFTAGAAAVGTSAASADVTGSDSLASSDCQYSEWLDSAVPPRLDFFRYANGGWIKANPMPAD